MSTLEIIKLVITILFGSVGALIIKSIYDTYKSQKVLFIRSKPGITTALRRLQDRSINVLVPGIEFNRVLTFDIEIENAGRQEIENQYIRFEFDSGAKIISDKITLPSPEHSFEVDSKSSTGYVRRYLINLLKPGDKIAVTFLTSDNKENFVKIDALGSGLKVVNSIKGLKSEHKVIKATLFISLLLSLTAICGIWKVDQMNRILYETVKSLIHAADTRAEIDDRKRRVGENLVTLTVITKEGISTQGSGFFVNSQGYLITPLHVVRSADKIVVQVWQDSSSSIASIVDTSKRYDLALLRVPPQSILRKLSPPIFADSTFKPSTREQVDIVTINTMTKQPEYLPVTMMPISKDSINIFSQQLLLSGASGSPVFFRDAGNVVGLFVPGENTRRLDDSTIISLPPLRLVTADHIKDLLRKDSVQFLEKHIHTEKSFSGPMRK